MSTLATELNVPPNSRHAFDELIAKTSQRLNRTLTSTDLAEWKDSLLSAAAEVDINAFIELPSTSATIARPAAERACMLFTVTDPDFPESCKPSERASRAGLMATRSAKLTAATGRSCERERCT